MTFEEYCIKFSRRNIKKDSNGSNYSDVSRKKGKSAVPLITWCWIMWDQKIKVHSLGNSFPRATLGGFFEISIFHFFGTLWRENSPEILAESCYPTNELWFFHFGRSSTKLSSTIEWSLSLLYLLIFLRENFVQYSPNVILQRTTGFNK